MTTRELGILLKISANSKEAQAALAGIAKQLNALPADARKASGGFADAFKRANQSVTDWSSSIKVQMGMAGALGAVAWFVKSSVMSLAEFEDKMVGVAKTTGMSADDIQKLGDALRDMSINAMRGTVSAESLGDIAQVAGQLGIKGAENIEAFTRNIAEMTVATGLSAEEAATGMAQIEQVFRQSLSQINPDVAELTANIGSAFNELENSTTATTRDLIDMTQRMGGAATTIGLTVDQVAAIAATLKDVGVDAEVGGTAMSKLFLQMLKDSDSFVDAFNLNAQRMADALKNDPIEALKMVMQGMEDLKKAKGPAELAKTLEDLGINDTRLAGAMLKLSTATDALETNLRTSHEAFKEGTSLHNEFVTASSSSLKQMQSVGEKSKEVFRSFGEELKPATTMLTNWTAGGLDTIINAVHAWRSGVKEEFFDGIVEMFSGNTAAWETWGNQVKGIGSTTFAGLKEIGASAVDSFSGVFSPLFTTITKPFGDAKTFINAEFGEIVTAVGDSVNAIISTVSTVTEQLVSPFREASSQITGLLEKIPGFGPEPEQIQIDFSQPLDALNSIRTEYRDLIMQQDGLLQSVQSVFVGYAQAAKEGVEPTQALQDELINLQNELIKVGIIAYGGSVFPDMVKAQEEARAKAAELTGQMTMMQGEVTKVGAAYEVAHAKVLKQEALIKSINDKILAYERQASTASNYRAKQIERIITQLELQKKSHQGVLDTLKEEERTAKDVYKEQERALIDVQREHEKATHEVDRYTQQIDESVKKLMEQSAEHIRAKQAIERYNNILGDVYKTTGQADRQTEDYVMTLEDLQASLQDTTNDAHTMADAMHGLGGILEDLGDAFNISGLGDIGGGLGKLPEIFGGIREAFSGIDLSGGLNGIIGSIPAIGGVISGLTSLWDIGKSVFGGLKDLFGNLFDTQSKGTEAANAWQNYVASTISGGQEMASALQVAFNQMSAAGFDYQRFLEIAGPATQNLHAALGGLDGGPLSALAAAIGEATGSMEKGNQIALQQVAAFASMGMSADEARVKIQEMISATQGAGEEGAQTGNIFTQTSASVQQLNGNVSQLSGSLAQTTGQLMGAGAEGLQASNVFTLTTGSAQQLATMTNSLASQVGGFAQQMSGANNQSVMAAAEFANTGGAAIGFSADMDPATASMTQFSAATGVAVLQLKALGELLKQDLIAGELKGFSTGGIASGLAIVNERGPEIARFRNGLMAMMTQPGPLLGAFPAGTEIIPHHRAARIVREHPEIPRMAEGGFVGTSAPIINITITGNTIDRGVNLDRLADQLSQKIAQRTRPYLR